MLDLLLQPPNLIPVMSPCLTAGLLRAVGEEYPAALIKGGEERRAGVEPPFRGPPEVRSAAAAVGRQGEEVGNGGVLEAEDRRRLLDTGEGAFTAGLGGRVAPHHQQRPSFSHPASLRESLRAQTRNYTVVISSN